MVAAHRPGGTAGHQGPPASSTFLHPAPLEAHLAHMGHMGGHMGHMGGSSRHTNRSPGGHHDTTTVTPGHGQLDVHDAAMHGSPDRHAKGPALDPILTSLSAVELHTVINLDLARIRNKIHAERAHVEYVPWYVRGRLPEDMAKDLGVSQATADAAPTLSSPRRAATAPVSGPGVGAGGHRRRLGTGMHADLMVAVETGVAPAAAKATHSSSGAKSGGGDGGGEARGAAGYMPLNFSEFVVAHREHGYNIAQSRAGAWGFTRHSKTQAVLSSLHEHLFKTGAGEPSEVGQPFLSDPYSSGSVSGEQRAMPAPSPFNRPGTVPTPLSRADHRRRFGGSTNGIPTSPRGPLVPTLKSPTFSTHAGHARPSTSMDSDSIQPLAHPNQPHPNHLNFHASTSSPGFAYAAAGSLSSLTPEVGGVAGVAPSHVAAAGRSLTVNVMAVVDQATLPPPPQLPPKVQVMAAVSEAAPLSPQLSPQVPPQAHATTASHAQLSAAHQAALHHHDLLSEPGVGSSPGQGLVWAMPGAGPKTGPTRPSDASGGGGSGFNVTDRGAQLCQSFPATPAGGAAGARGQGGSTTRDTPGSSRNSPPCAFPPPPGLTTSSPLPPGLATQLNSRRRMLMVGRAEGGSRPGSRQPQDMSRPGSRQPQEMARSSTTVSRNTRRGLDTDITRAGAQMLERLRGLPTGANGLPIWVGSYETSPRTSEDGGASSHAPTSALTPAPAAPAAPAATPQGPTYASGAAIVGPQGDSVSTSERPHGSDLAAAPHAGPGCAPGVGASGGASGGTSGGGGSEGASTSADDAGGTWPESLAEVIGDAAGSQTTEGRPGSPPKGRIAWAAPDQATTAQTGNPLPGVQPVDGAVQGVQASSQGVQGSESPLDTPGMGNAKQPLAAAGAQGPVSAVTNATPGGKAMASVFLQSLAGGPGRPSPFAAGAIRKPTSAKPKRSAAATEKQPKRSGKEMVAVRAAERAQRRATLGDGVEGPGLLEDWRAAALERMVRTPNVRLRPKSGTVSRPASTRARTKPQGLSNLRTHPSSQEKEDPPSPLLSPRRMSSRHGSRRSSERKLMAMHRSELGAKLWARLAAVGPRKIIALQASGVEGGMGLDAAAADHSIGGDKRLGFLQHLQQGEAAQKGLAGTARARLRALERVTPGLRLGSSSTNNNNASGGHPDVPRLVLGGDNHDVAEILQTPRTTRTDISDTPLSTVRGGALYTEVDEALAGAGSIAEQLRARLLAQNEALVVYNPVAFSEDSAAQAEAEHRSAAEMAVRRLRAVSDSATLVEEPEDKLLNALQAAVRDLHVKRPFFHGPLLTRPKVARAHVQQAEDELLVKPEWTLQTSIFALRRKECESRDFYDNDKVKAQQFQLDWDRVATKVRFRKLVAREDKGVSDSAEGLDVELSEVRQELEQQKDAIRSIFNYYSMITGGPSQSSAFSISMNQWLGFCNEASVINTSGQRGTTSGDLQTVFVAVNFEEESDTQESAANDDDAMMRFEFLEGLVRAAFGKFIATKKCDDASDAVHMLLNQVVIPCMPPEALIDPNVFRRDRLYNEAMDLSVRSHLELLQGMYKVYKAKDRTKYFNIEHWASLLESTGIIGLHTGIEYREIKMIFAYSQMMVTDELKRRKRATCLQFFDFLEALARVADLMSPLTSPEVDAWFAAATEAGTPRAATAGANRLSEYYRLVGSAGVDLKRESAELVATPTRPLSEKFESLIELMLARLRDKWGGKDEKECAAKMKKAAIHISGGVELG